MIATLTKLFPIRIVANKRCGVLSNRRILLSVFTSLSSNSFNINGSSEKKATSEAEINAEIQRSKTVITNEIIAEIVIG